MGEATPEIPQPPATAEPPEKTALYVGDLDAAVNEDDLLQVLGNFGSILSVHICRDRTSGNSLRYAYVNFKSKFSAECALQKMNHVTVKGRPMRIMWTDRNSVGRKNGIGNLFVKNLDESIGGLDLEVLFRPYGHVDSCKVQLDEKGRSRGFGFVQMNTEEAAQSAIAALNGTILKNTSKKLYVAKFVKKSERQASHEQEQDGCNLYIKNLEKDFTDGNLYDKFSEYGKINSVIVMKDENGNSKGFGFVSFESSENAKKAMDAMNGAKLGTKTIYVGPAQKKIEREETKKNHTGQPLSNNTLGTTVFVKNIEDTVTDEALQEHFSSCGKILWLKLPRHNDGKCKGIGFVCFASIEEANKAVATLNKSKLNGKNLSVVISQNKENRSKLSEAKSYFTNNCLQIPHPTYLASAYHPGRFIGNHGLQYLPSPTNYAEQIRNYSSPSYNTIPFNTPMNPMMFHLPQESHYSQRYLQSPRYEKGMQKTFQQPSSSGVKKVCCNREDQQLMARKAKTMEFIYSNMPLLEAKQATECDINGKLKTEEN